MSIPLDPRRILSADPKDSDIGAPTSGYDRGSIEVDLFRLNNLPAAGLE
jgi:hypothetical protein